MLVLVMKPYLVGTSKQHFRSLGQELVGRWDLFACLVVLVDSVDSMPGASMPGISHHRYHCEQHAENA